VERTHEISVRGRVNDSVRWNLCTISVTVQLLIGPCFQTVVLQFVAQPQALPQDVGQRLTAGLGQIDDVVEESGHNAPL
jgi:hypothetical protein